MPLNPLELIRRLIPANATKAEAQMYKDLLAETSARGATLDKRLQALLRKNPDAQDALLASPKWQSTEKLLHPVRQAQSNLVTARYAAPNADDTARMLLATTPDEAKHAASMIYRPPGHFNGDRGIPPNSVFIEGLSSEIPGGGTQLLKQLESQYPRLPMVLESVSNPDTLEFYVRKGFLPRADKSSDAIPRNLFIKDADTKIRAALAAPLVTGQSSVLDKEPSWKDKLNDLGVEAVQGILDALKDPLGVIGGGLGAASAAYRHGGAVKLAGGGLPGAALRYLVTKSVKDRAPSVLADSAESALGQVSPSMRLKLLRGKRPTEAELEAHGGLATYQVRARPHQRMTYEEGDLKSAIDGTDFRRGGYVNG